MTETVNEDSGVGRSVEASSNGHHSLSGESLSLSKWRSSAQVENGTPSTSLSYWDTDDDEDHGRSFCSNIFFFMNYHLVLHSVRLGFGYLQDEFLHTLYKLKVV